MRKGYDGTGFNGLSDEMRIFKVYSVSQHGKGEHDSAGSSGFKCLIYMTLLNSEPWVRAIGTPSPITLSTPTLKSGGYQKTTPVPPNTPTKSGQKLEAPKSFEKYRWQIMYSFYCFLVVGLSAVNIEGGEM